MNAAGSRPLISFLRQTGPVASRRIRVRVSLLLLRDGTVYLLKSVIQGREVWFLPGGAVDWGEDLATAARREGSEELGVEVTVGDAVAVLDSIAPDGSFHAVEIVLRCKCADEPRACEETLSEGELPEGRYGIEGRWFRPRELAAIEAYPRSFLTERLADLVAGDRPATVYLGNDW